MPCLHHLSVLETRARVVLMLGGASEKGAGFWALLTVATLLLPLLIRLAWILIEGPLHVTAASAYRDAKAAQRQAQDLRSSPQAYVLPIEHRTEAAARLADLLPETELENGSRQDARAAIETLLDWHAARASGDPDAYASWAKANGLRIMESFPNTPPYQPDALEGVWRWMFREPLPENIAPREFFDLYHNAYAERSDGALAPRGVLAHPDTVEIHFARFTHPADHLGLVPYRASGLGDAFWIGGVSASGLRLWMPETSLADVIERDGHALACRIMTVYEGRTGMLVPTSAVLFYDPRADRWTLHDYSVQNIIEGVPGLKGDSYINVH